MQIFVAFILEKHQISHLGVAGDGRVDILIRVCHLYHLSGYEDVSCVILNIINSVLTDALQ